jgi:hypothetical protein
MISQKVDITMTAVVRPGLLNRTLSSISDKICKDRDGIRLVINIDPIGEAIKPMKVVRTAQKYFDNVIFNIAKSPSFPKAVKWVWTNSDAPYIFHIEDDWLINRDIDVNDMINILKKNEKLSSLRLYKYKTPKSNKFKTFGCKWIYNNEDGFYLSTDWKKQFGLNPILIKREFINQALPKMRDDINPEKQFRYSQGYMRKIIKDWQYGLYTKPGNGVLVTDIGREWIRNTEFAKPKVGTFLTWMKK